MVTQSWRGCGYAASFVSVRSRAQGSTDRPVRPLRPATAAHHTHSSGTIPAMKSLNLVWRFVLVRPRNPLNIGAAARAMANFRLSRIGGGGALWSGMARNALGGGSGGGRHLGARRGELGGWDRGRTLGCWDDRRLPAQSGPGPYPLPDFPAWLRRRRAKGHRRPALRFREDRPFEPAPEFLPRPGSYSRPSWIVLP